MKIQVSLSKANSKVQPLVAGDRIVYKEGENRWRTGTIEEHRVAAKIMWIKFDNATESERLTDDQLKDLHRIPRDSKKSKKILSDADAHKLLSTSTKPSDDPNAKLDEKLGILYTQVHDPKNRLMAYLAGDKVPTAWLDSLSKRVSPDQPEILYRMCVVSARSKLGSTIKVDKSIVSSSDRKLNAIHAGCSYHVNNDISVAGKALALIEIHKPKCVLSHRELLAIVGPGKGSITTTTRDEREYILSGPVKGKVIQMLNIDLIEKRAYTKILPYLRKTQTPAGDKKMLAYVNAE